MTRQAAILPSIGNLARAAAALVLSVCAASAVATPDWDLMGLRLGMTEDEVTAAFKAYNPNGQINVYNSNYTYSDKVNSFRTPPFLSSMDLRVTTTVISTPLRVWFSGPDGDVRVIAIAREEINLPNPPTAAEFNQTVYDKYGEPTHRMSNGAPIWQEAGKPSCITTRNSYGESISLQEFPQVASGHKTMEQAVQMLEIWQQRPAEQAAPEDLGTCGAFMYYPPGRDAMRSFRAAIFDVGAIVDTHRRRMAWVSQLEADAIRARESQGQRPRL
ncbi:MAG: hypothetical protein JJT88_05455 [Gammaproteobacteria bacterium]|nr:hypothetical protein [Gammaproteobacteria bacterium]